MKTDPFHKPPWWQAYSFTLVTGLLFLLSWYGQFYFQAVSFVNDAAEHGVQAKFSDYLTQFAASTLENWQSEFLQLVWQAAGLAMFLHWGSSQSREGAARAEEKIDRLLRRQGIDPDTLL